jgi:hypothetical protein
LIVANRSLGGHRLEQVMLDRHAATPGTQFHLIVPERGVETYEFTWAAGFGVPMAMGTVIEDGLRQTEKRMDEVLEHFRSLGLDITGELGPAPPLAAIEKALEEQPYEEIIISTLPAVFSRWLRMDLPRRAERRFGLPVTTIVHDADDAELIPLDAPVIPQRADSTASANAPASADAERVAGRDELRAVAAEHRVEVLAVDDGGGSTRRAGDALAALGVCCMHEVSSAGQAVAYLRGEGRFAGRARPDLVVLAADALGSGMSAPVSELAREVAREKLALLVVATAERSSARALADQLDAWAFTVLGEDVAENADVLEVMIVELVALERRQ